MNQLPKYASRKVSLSAAEAKAEAQRIAFGPVVFQAVCALQDLGLFRLLWERRETGCRIEEAASRVGLSEYAVRVLFESALLARVLEVEGDRFTLSKVGYFLHRDELTGVNLSFVRDVCYSPAQSLVQSLRQGRPVGLERLFSEAKPAVGEGDALPETVYEGLLALPEKVLESWLSFDHFYSDRSFAEALELIAERPIRRLLDVGANTGRFAAECLKRLPDVSVTLLDHPAQLDRAGVHLERLGFGGRFTLAPTDLLDEALDFPGGMDGVWLSQLLDCFSEERAIGVLAQARRSLGPNGSVYVLEPCWDLQPQESGSFCLVQTSLYFTSVANGDSRMYDSKTLERLIEQSGLRVERRIDGLGVGHSLFVCQSA